MRRKRVRLGIWFVAESEAKQIHRIRSAVVAQVWHVLSPVITTTHSVSRSVAPCTDDDLSGRTSCLRIRGSVSRVDPHLLSSGIESCGLSSSTSCRPNMVLSGEASDATTYRRRGRWSAVRLDACAGHCTASRRFDGKRGATPSGRTWSATKRRYSADPTVGMT